MKNLSIKNNVLCKNEINKNLIELEFIFNEENDLMLKNHTRQKIKNV